jgi:CubicO group peptidase (beta-lactamase class C family)
MMRTCTGLLALAFITAPALNPVRGADPPPTTNLSEYFPPTESKGGWRSLLPEKGNPSAAEKAKIREVAGVDWDKLEQAWKHNESAPGGTGLLVIRNGYVVGEWYKNGDRRTDYNIYSSSKSYTSTAYGLILSDFGNGPLPDGRKISLDTKVCEKAWLPESLPLTDPHKADITVRNLLNMISGVGGDNVPLIQPFEWSLGRLKGSPMAQLKGEPGTVFNYSNAGVAHLVLVFWHAQGEDLFPFLTKHLFEPIGISQVRWQSLGGDAAMGPYSQGFSGIYTNPREHARFCYLALHKGEWAGKRVVPEAYYDFAWSGSKVKADYGAQWWVYPHVEGAPKDMVMTLGRNHNDGFVVPSLDLVFVRLGNGAEFPKNFEHDLVHKVLAAVDR